MLVFRELKLFMTSAALGKKKCQFKLEGVFTVVFSKNCFLPHLYLILFLTNYKLSALGNKDKHSFS
jgi:hypothetical protein